MANRGHVPPIAIVSYHANESCFCAGGFLQLCHVLRQDLEPQDYTSSRVAYGSEQVPYSSRNGHEPASARGMPSHPLLAVVDDSAV